jgi:mitogen-activated protein kinase 15
MCDTIDHQILMEYELVKKIGKGAYGQVWKVIHKSTRKVYAIKKIYDAFRNTLDSRRTYR